MRSNSYTTKYDTLLDIAKYLRNRSEDGGGLHLSRDECRRIADALSGSEPENDEVKAILQKACDRDWKDETLLQTAHIASNAIYWRDQEIAKLKAQSSPCATRLPAQEPK